MVYRTGFAFRDARIPGMRKLFDRFSLRKSSYLLWGWRREVTTSKSETESSPAFLRASEDVAPSNALRTTERI
jgi:hypothetical protein